MSYLIYIQFRFAPWFAGSRLIFNSIASQNAASNKSATKGSSKTL